MLDFMKMSDKEFEKVVNGDPALMSNEEFDAILQEIVQENAASILTVPGAYEILSEEFNNAVCDRWSKDKLSDMAQKTLARDWDRLHAQLCGLLERLNVCVDWDDDPDREHHIKVDGFVSPQDLVRIGQMIADIDKIRTRYHAVGGDNDLRINKDEESYDKKKKALPHSRVRLA